MKSIIIALVALLVLHLLVAGAGVGWLGVTDRLSKDRFRRTVEIFRWTQSEEKVKLQEAQVLADEEAQKQADMNRLAEVADGPTTVSDRLRMDHESRELAMNKVERLQREIKDMSRHLEFAKTQLTRQKKELDAEMTLFSKLKNELASQRSDKDFERVVKTYESLKPKQAKMMLANLIDQGQMDQAVSYLAAMQLRKSAAILNQFKQEEEIPVAGELLERLRARGIVLKPSASMARK